MHVKIRILIAADDEAALAARLLGIDYSPALTGFSFRGRHGTAVLTGVVVAKEYREAVEAVIEGYRDEKARLEEEKRTHTAHRMWRRFLLALRIKERVDGYVVEDVEAPDVFSPRPGREDMPEDSQEDDGKSMESAESDDDYRGGGFLPE